MSSDESADRLAAARGHIESALGGIALAAHEVPQAWAAIHAAGAKYAEKYGRMAGAGGRLNDVLGQMQTDIENLTADEANERSGTV